MRKSLVIIMGLICLVLGAAAVMLSFTADKEAPEITIDDTVITYTEGSDTTVLLEGVTAYDNRDGDVTDSLVVEAVFPNADKGKATVIYVAKDSSNNVAKITREVNYQASAVIDETESSTEEAADANDTVVEAAVQEEDPFADLSPESPRITLTTDAVTIKQGESFNQLSYISEITDDADSSELLWTRIQITGEVDINTIGIYEISYTVTDTDGNSSNAAKLTVVVE